MPAADPRSGSLFPYLLRDMTIERPNQVWATDITYTAVSGHRAFVIGIIDLFSRKVMAYNVVNTMDAWYCVETLQEAVRRYGRPGNLQFGSRQSVHQRGVHPRAEGERYSHQHGWARTLPSSLSE